MNTITHLITTLLARRAPQWLSFAHNRESTPGARLPSLPFRGTSLALVLGMMPVTAGFAQPLYAAKDIGTVGENKTYGADLNLSGEITGDLVDSTGTPTPFLYSHGRIKPLGSLAGGVRFGMGVAINQAGNAVGVSTTTAGAFHAFVYSRGKMRDLGALPGGNESYARDINNHGAITGYASINSSSNYHAFLYSNGRMKDLGLGDRSLGLAINDSGEITGAYTVAGPNGPAFHAFLYSDGSKIDLGTLGGPSSSGADINRWGEVAGTSSLTQDPASKEHAFLYSDGKMVDLGALSPGMGSQANKINRWAQVVGSSETPNGGRAFLFAGVMHDLNDLVLETHGWTLISATGINDAGQILCVAQNTAGKIHSILLTPIPNRGMGHRNSN